PGGVGGGGGGQAGAQRGRRNPAEQGAERLAADLAEPLPVGGGVGVHGGGVPVGLPADRRPLGEQPVLAGEVRQQPAGVGGVVRAERGDDDGRRPPGGHRGVVIAGDGGFHDRLQQVPLVTPVVVQALHRDAGPAGDPGHGGRRVAALGELGPG